MCYEIELLSYCLAGVVRHLFSWRLSKEQTTIWFLLGDSIVSDLSFGDWTLLPSRDGTPSRTNEMIGRSRN